uniref:Putative secreted protein n=1 Tax=Ixodes ricinus TaxID=34613 RepID=A0A6B0U0N5_IXORI
MSRLPSCLAAAMARGCQSPVSVALVSCLIPSFAEHWRKLELRQPRHEFCPCCLICFQLSMQRQNQHA